MNQFILTLIAGMLIVANPNKWEEVDKGDGITVWIREVHLSDISEVKAQTIVALDMQSIWAVLNDVSLYKEFMPYIEEAKILPNKIEGGHYEYHHIAPPLVNERDYTIKVICTKTDTQWQRSWTLANDIGPKENADVVRVKISEGTWTLKKLGPKKTLLTYWLYTNPGGSIPAWIANMANNISVPDLLNAVRSRAKDPKWTP